MGNKTIAKNNRELIRAQEKGGAQKKGFEANSKTTRNSPKNKAS